MSFPQQPATSAADTPIYGGLAVEEELRLVLRLVESHTSGTSSPARLKLGKKLGRGSEGDVYKATFDGTSVAIKVMKRRDRRSPKEWRKVVAEFLAEARLLRLCQGQSTILGLHAACEFPASMLIELEGSSRASPLPAFGLILDLSQRGTLRDLVEHQMNDPAHLVYTDAEALNWCMDIAAAVRYLHQLTPIIIHRDIKLENVLLHDGPTRSSAKLCDFGLAAIGYEALPASRRTLRAQADSTTASRQASRQASTTGSLHIEDTARLISDPLSAGARMAAAAERAVAAAMAEVSPRDPPQRATPERAGLAKQHISFAVHIAESAPASPGKRSAAAPSVPSNGINNESRHSEQGPAQTSGNYASALRPDLARLSAPALSPTANGAGAGAGPGGGLNPRLLTLQLLQAQDQAAAAGGVSQGRGSVDGVSRRQTADGVSFQEGTNGNKRPSNATGGGVNEALRAVGGLSTRRRMSVRQTVAFALPDAPPPGEGGGAAASGAADLPNLVAGDDELVGESFNARRRLSRCSSAGSFASRASSVSVTGRTGSLAYLAPEVDSRMAYNESADVFSFAVLMYQLFARKSLVLECRDTEGALEKLQMRMTEGFRPNKPTGCHADVWEVIEACWQPISTDRPMMDEVLQQLDAVVVELAAQQVVLDAAAAIVAAEAKKQASMDRRKVAPASPVHAGGGGGAAAAAVVAAAQGRPSPPATVKGPPLKTPPASPPPAGASGKAAAAAKAAKAMAVEPPAPTCACVIC